jgi:hypothetical protein
MNNGYATVEINGEQIGLKFGMHVMQAMMGKPIPAIDEETKQMNALDALMYTSELLYEGYINNCLVKKERPSLSFQPFYDYVEDAFLDVEKTKKLNEEVVQVFTLSKFVEAGKEKLQKAAAELTKKKNGQQTKSKSSATVS